MLTAPKDLPEGYYLKNFLELVQFVYQQYFDILKDDEREYYSRFCQLPLDAQYLYVRMLMRKGNIFRISKLRYREICCIESACKQLQMASFIIIDPPLTLVDALPLFNKHEWLECLARSDIVQENNELARLSRKDLDNALLDIGDELLMTLNDDIVQIKDSEYFNVFSLLYFTHAHQDLTEFVLRDLGVLQYESYKIDQGSRYFKSRAVLDSYLHYYRLIENIDSLKDYEHDEIISLSDNLSCLVGDEALARRIHRYQFKLARQLERTDFLDQALKIYNDCELVGAMERKARIFFSLQKYEKALSICEQIKSSSTYEVELDFARGFGLRVAKKLNCEWHTPPSYFPPETKLIIEKSELNVEQAVADFYLRDGSCHYVENHLFLTVLGLYFWDVIFLPVQGAFSHPFQSRPHDLYENKFSKKRQLLWTEKWRRLDAQGLNTAELFATYEQKYKISNAFISWDLVDQPLIKLAVERIPAAHWCAIFTRLWSDIRENRSGMPDLIFFPSRGGYELIEVKGPGDRVQANQQRWMRYFAEHDIPHRVTWVEWC